MPDLYRAIQNVENDLQKGVKKFSSRQNEISSWESKTKLSLRGGKSLFNSYAAELSSVTKSLEQKLEQFNSQYDSLTGRGKKNNNNNNNGKQKFASVSGQVKLVQQKLDEAMKSGMNAEKLLIQAKQTGIKEAAQFMKQLNVPSSTASVSGPQQSNPSAPTTVATLKK